MNEFMKAQIEAIEIYKWIESEKRGYDLGREASKEWVKLYAKKFREKWNKDHGI